MIYYDSRLEPVDCCLNTFLRILKRRKHLLELYNYNLDLDDEDFYSLLVDWNYEFKEVRLHGDEAKLIIKRSPMFDLYTTYTTTNSSSFTVYTYVTTSSI